MLAGNEHVTLDFGRNQVVSAVNRVVLERTHVESNSLVVAILNDGEIAVTLVEVVQIVGTIRVGNRDAVHRNDHRLPALRHLVALGDAVEVLLIASGNSESLTGKGDFEIASISAIHGNGAVVHTTLGGSVLHGECLLGTCGNLSSRGEHLEGCLGTTDSRSKGVAANVLHGERQFGALANQLGTKVESSGAYRCHIVLRLIESKGDLGKVIHARNSGIVLVDAGISGLVVFCIETR